ncbi:MAG: GNAT family N-acetyltransferase [Chthoniobacterales bacterium]
MADLRIEIERNASAETRHCIIRGLVTFNEARSGDASHQELTVVARADGEIVGGLLAYTHWEWLFITQLWVAEAAGGHGVGTRLLRTAESEAVLRGCRHAHVDTFSFQARPFYERRGYTVFAELADYPAGHTRYFLQKRDLSPSCDA